MATTPQGSNHEETTTLGTASGSLSGRPESEYINLNKGFGETNKLYSSGLTNDHYTKNRVISYFKSLKDTTNDKYKESRISKSGPWYGVVLSVSNGRHIKHPGNTQDTTVTPVYRVRIPELHAHLPFPTTYYGDPCKIESDSGFAILDDPRIDAKTYDSLVVELYPEFRYMKSGDTIRSYSPRAGDVVWVDFVDKETQETGILLEPASEPKTTIGTKKIYSKGSGPFKTSSGAQNTAGASSATGAALDGSQSEATEQGQVAKFTNSNSPFLQKNGYNFFSSDGGFLIQEKTTLEGITSKIIDENGNMTNKYSNILNKPIQTEVRLIEMSNLNENSYGVNEKYYSDKKLFNLTTNKVRTYAYGDLNRYSHNLVVAPSVKRVMKLHILAARRLEAMNYEFLAYISQRSQAERDEQNITGIFKLSRAAEFNKYDNDYEKYRDHLIEKYGSFETGKSIEKFHNSYETGLVFDIGNNGLKTYKHDSIAFEFLISNAWKYGIYSSGENVFKWEVQVPRENWFSGKDFVNKLGTSYPQNSQTYNNEYAIFVSEKSIETGKLTSDRYYDYNVFN